MVFASRPVASLNRLAARPVGAQTATDTDFAATIVRMDLVSVVLPTPGPPVITMILLVSATATARRWLVANSTPSLPSTQGMALPASIVGHGGLPVARSC